MVEFDIQYKITNKYDTPVRKANFQLLVTPYRIHEQRVLESMLFCEPAVTEHISSNTFGFVAIHYYINQPFTEFHFEYKAKVRRAEVNPYSFNSFPIALEKQMMSASDFYIQHHLFLAETSLTTLPIGYKEQFPVYNGDVQIFDYLLSLNTFINQFMHYVPDFTTTETSIEEILKIPNGVCQDYAHLFIALCRANKIPCRYVSGYLNQGSGYQGVGQLHAWIEAYLPGLGWMGFDPTNNLLVDENYIKIAHGTDYYDCSPIKGVLEHTGVQKSDHSVTVINQ